MLFFFFFQAEDGIRDHCVTGVQTCALPILGARSLSRQASKRRQGVGHPEALPEGVVGRQGIPESRRRRFTFAALPRYEGEVEGDGGRGIVVTGPPRAR